MMHRSDYGRVPLLRPLRLLHEDRWGFTWLAVGIVAVLIPLILVEPFLVRKGTNMVIIGGGPRLLLTLIGMVLAYYAVRMLVELALNYASLRLAARVHTRLLADSIRDFVNKDLSLVKSIPRGDVLYCLFNDSQRVAAFASLDMVGLFSNVCFFLACVGLAVHFDPRLAALSVGYIVALSLLHLRLARVVFAKQMQAREIEQDLSGRVQNMLSGIITLKGFNLVDPIIGQWIEKYRPRWVLEIAIRMIAIMLAALAVHGHMVFSFVILYLRLRQAESLAGSLGETFAFLTVYNRMAQPFQFFVAFSLGLQDTKAAIVRHYRLRGLGTGRPAVHKASRSRVRPLAGMGTQPLTIRDGTTVLGNKEIRIPDLELHRGRTYLLEGPNGAGKTTTGLVLAGLLPLRTGLYSWNSRSSVPPYEASQIIYLEKDGYWPEGTILENCRLSEPSGQVDEGRLDRYLELCMCNDLIASLPLGKNNPIASDWSFLSSGESQRLFMAFAMYHEPDVLIIDEALTHVPIEIRKQILENVRIARPDMIMLLISHHAGDRELVDEVVSVRPKRFYN